MAYVDQMPGTRRVTTIAGVAAAHLLLGYVFISGMAVDIVRTVVPSLEITNIPVPVPPPPPEIVPEPPRPMERAVPRTIPRVQPVTVDPIVVVPLSQGPVIASTDRPQPPVVSVDSGPVVVPTAPVMASQATGAKVRGDRGGWISTSDYPSSALRAGEEGTVGISVSIGADGRVSSCSVRSPSGSAALDQVTCRLYARNARFAPARDDAGTAIASTYSDRVRWRLPTD